MKRLLLILAFCLVPMLVSAQQLASGSLTATGQSISASPTLQTGALAIQVTGTWSGTLTFQGSVDGVTYVTALVTNKTSGATATTTTANGVWTVGGDWAFVRLYGTSIASGRADITMLGSNSGGSGGAGGGGGGGSVTQGTDPWIVAGNGTAGTAATGVLTIQGIASMTPVVIGDGAGAINVICDSGCSGGTQYTQDAALTVATSVGTMAMGRGSAAAPTDVSANNDAVMPWYLLSGAQAVQPTYAGVLGVAGNGASGTGVPRVTIANDSTGILAGVTTVGTVTTVSTLTGGGVAAGAADSGNPIKVGGVYNSTLPTLDNGDRGNIQLTADGSVIVKPSLTGQFATDATHDSAALTTGPQAMLVGAASGALPTAVTAGDAVRAAATLQGVAYMRTPDPCSDEALKVYFPVDIVTATTTEIVNQSASNYFRLCSINLVSAGANNIAIVEDDTDACASPTAGLNGGVTAGEGWNIGSNGGMSVGSGMASVMRSSVVNRYVCIITSAAVQLSGTVVYTLAP